MIEDALVSCIDCGKSQSLPELAPGSIARCRRCRAVLRQTWSNPLTLWLALTVASLVLLAAGASEKLAIVEAGGQVRTATLFSGPARLAQTGLWELSVLVLATTVAAPFLTAAAALYVGVGTRLARPPPALRTVFAWRNRLRPWSMIEVFLIGYFVAYSKLGALARITPGPGFYALFGLMVTTIASDAFLDRQAVWEAIQRADPTAPRRPAARRQDRLVACPVCQLACGLTHPQARCPRCLSRVHARKPDSVARTAALAGAALILYVPANLFPVLTVVQFGRGSPSTILDGVLELLSANELPLAAIVFVASVAIPVLKLVALATMLWVIVGQRQGGPHARHLTILYRVVLAIGRWSMIDIFMESILAGLVQFGKIARIDPGDGAIAFASVVVLTIFAAESFDPRLLWDRRPA